MNSEKVKEIKKCLVFCKDRLCEVCPRLKQEPNQEEDCRCALIEQSLTLINELESELEKEQINNLNCDTELQYKEKRIAELETLCDKTYKDLTKEIDRLENRVKELEDGIAKSMLGCEFLPECTNDKLKQFAEMLKEKAKNLKLGSVEVHNFLWANDIDETLNEFINKGDDN